MKVIFLDIDGVLNNHDSMHRAYEKGLDAAGIRGWDRGSVDELKRIVAETGARIVISSTWRLNISDRRSEHAVAAGFEMYGIPEFTDVTPNFPGKIRGLEIKSWMDNWAEEPIESFVILDDDSDMLPEQMAHFVQPSLFRGGLNKELADKAIEILNG